MQPFLTDTPVVHLAQIRNDLVGKDASLGRHAEATVEEPRSLPARRNCIGREDVWIHLDRIKAGLYPSPQLRPRCAVPG